MNLQNSFWDDAGKIQWILPCQFCAEIMLAKIGWAITFAAPFLSEQGFGDCFVGQEPNLAMTGIHYQIIKFSN